MRRYDEKYLTTKNGRAHNLLSSYRQKDKLYKRGECTLTARWIVDNIFSKPCAHCGETDWRKIGCNRLDNSKPHTEDNVEPCCFKCNTELGITETTSNLSKTTHQISPIDGEVVKIWNSVSDTKISGYNPSSVAICCRGGRINKGKWENCKTYKGYIWRYPL